MATKDKEKKESEFSGEHNSPLGLNKGIQSHISRKEIVRDSISSSMTLINDISMN